MGLLFTIQLYLTLFSALSRVANKLSPPYVADAFLVSQLSLIRYIPSFLALSSALRLEIVTESAVRV
jgi:hypothetical protein